MFAQFTQTYGLHNLLWTFALTATSSAATIPDLYPGGNYVDIVGTDTYIDTTSPTQLSYPFWVSYFNLGKIVTYPERGPAETNGTSTIFESLLNGITSNSLSTQNVAPSFMAWESGFAIVNNLGASALMNDSRAANRTDVASVMACMSAATAFAALQSCALND